jgi:hypothetical protein
LTQTLAPWGRGGGRRLPGPPPPPGLVRGGRPPGSFGVFAHRYTQFQAVAVTIRGSYGGAFFVGFGGSSLNSTWTYVPGGAGGRRARRVSPTHVALPGKPRARGNPRWRGTQRGARCLRGCRSIPIHTYPEGILGIDGWATRTGRGCDAPAACSESGVGDGVVSTPSSPAAGDRGNGEPGCRCPTGPALRPTNKRGVSSGNRWLDRKGPRLPRATGGSGTGGGASPKLLAARIARVCTWGWDTPYGEQRVSPRVLLATLWPPYPSSRNLVGWGVQLLQQGWWVIRARAQVGAR